MIRIEAEHALENKVKFKQHPAMKTSTVASSTDLHSFLSLLPSLQSGILPQNNELSGSSEVLSIYLRFHRALWEPCNFQLPMFAYMFPFQPLNISTTLGTILSTMKLSFGLSSWLTFRFFEFLVQLRNHATGKNQLFSIKWKWVLVSVILINTRP